MGRFGSHIPRIGKALKLVWQPARGWTMAWASLLMLQGLLPAVIVYLARPLVNSLLGAMRGGGDPRRAVLYAAAMAVALLAGELLRSASTWVRTGQAELVRNHVARLVHEKSSEVDLGFYETPEFFDRLHRARAEASSVPLTLFENIGGLAQNTITLCAMAGILMTYGVWVPAALIFSTLPAVYVVLRYTARQHAWWLSATPAQRRSDYYDYVLTSAEYAAELRLFDLSSWFRVSFAAVRDKLAAEKTAMARAESVAEFSAGAIALAISGMSFFWIGARAVRGQASAGDLALFYQAFQQGLGLMRMLLANVREIYRGSLYLEGLFEFLELEPLVKSPPLAISCPARLAHGIAFRNVSFAYPGTERTALEQFSLEVPAGTITAIVGENGAGKSTLIKLLCRFYDVSEGSIAVDGHDVREFRLEDLRGKVAALMQEPVHYYATLGENIAPAGVSDNQGISAAAQMAAAAAIAEKLPLGYSHPLGRWFEDGAELSVGEWQRIALARAFYRAAPILVLDEPTSSMDPWAEADWLDRFRRFASGRTAIVITHRFTTARIADRIAVMIGGRVVEEGSHDELLARNGHYAAGWQAQTEGVSA